jgi:hypothetical protein
MALSFAVSGQELAMRTPRTPQTAEQIMDLVVEVPTLQSNKEYDVLKGRLCKIESVRVKGFCRSNNYLFLRFHPDDYFNVLVAIDEAGYQYYIKKDLSLSAGINTCTESSLLLQE